MDYVEVGFLKWNGKCPNVLSRISISQTHSINVWTIDGLWWAYVFKYKCLRLSDLVANYPTTDLRIRETLKTGRITCPTRGSSWSTTRSFWSSNKFPVSRAAGLCCVRHVEVGNSSPSRTTTATWSLGVRSQFG